MKVMERIVISALVVVLGIAVSTLPAGAQAAKGKELLNNLVAKAKEEGGLDTATITQAGPAVPRLISAFNKRFGMNLRINVALGDQAGKFAKLITTLDAGGRPEFDSLTGSENDIIVTVEKGYTTPIGDWQALLAAVSPSVASGAVKPAEVSPDVVGGHSFVWATRTKALVYHTKLASKDTIPRSIVDLANPKFKGKFTVAPWTDIFEQGTLVYQDKAEWLNIMDKIGKNAAGVLKFEPALNRILLGEFPFTYMNSAEYWEIKRKDASAPIGLWWFTDYTPMSHVMYIVPKGSRRPAAATLWALWMTTNEAHEIVQRTTPQENLRFGESDIDKQSMVAIKESGSRLVSYLESKETVEDLKWWATPEGRAYRAKLKEAVTQRN